MTRKIKISPELERIIDKMNGDLAYLLTSDIHDETWISNPEKVFDYIGLSKSDKNHLSYLTKERIEKIQKENGDFWDSNLRYHSKPGSLMKKIFKVSDRDIEDFTNQFISIVNPPKFTFEIVKGKDIATHYNYNYYHAQSGSLGGSCMKSVPSEFFDIYVNNNNISMLLMLSENKKVMGRSLLWDCGDVKLMDRVYVNNDSNLHYFYKWAKDNGYYCKRYNNFYTPKDLIYDDKCEVKHLTIDLENSIFKKYPYLDTFKWLDTNKKQLYNYIPKDLTHVITISDHMGNYFEPNHFKFCDMTGHVHLSSDVLYLKYLNKNVYSGRLTYSRSMGCYIYEEHCVRKDDIDDYIFNFEYDHFNDYDNIQKYKEKYEENKKNRSFMDCDFKTTEENPIFHARQGLYAVRRDTIVLEENPGIERPVAIETLPSDGNRFNNDPFADFI